jgi:hypothetical protein
MKSIQNEAKAEVLRNLAQSWSRLAGQIDRYNALVRDQDREARIRVVSTKTAPVTNVCR